MSKEINVKEFRIGSIINHWSGIREVTGIMVDSIEFIPIKDINSTGDTLDNIDPIELTEDWLEISGAIKCAEDAYRFGRFTLIWKPGYKYWYVISFPEDTYLTKIEWVHEWQNFVFIMNGHELTLTNK